MFKPADDNQLLDDDMLIYGVCITQDDKRCDPWLFFPKLAAGGQLDEQSKESHVVLASEGNKADDSSR